MSLVNIIPSTSVTSLNVVRNDIVWICQQCQRDETCVQCNECFTRADHTNHDVYFYHSQAGGCCDCGDAGAWATAGNCTVHGHASAVDSASMLPAGVRERAEQSLPQVASVIAEFCITYEQLFHQAGPHNQEPSQPLVIRIHKDDIHNLTEKEDEISSLFGLEADKAELHSANIHIDGFADLQLTSVDEDIECLKFIFIEYITALRAKNYLACFLPSAIKSRELWVMFLCRWLLSLAQASDGMLHLIARAFESIGAVQIIFSHFCYLSKPLLSDLHSLLVSLVADNNLHKI